MASVTQNYTVSFIPGKLPTPVVRIKQSEDNTGYGFDSAQRALVFTLEDLENLPAVGDKDGATDYTVTWVDYRLKGKKPNGLGFNVSGLKDKTTGTVKFKVNKQLSECSGCMLACIEVIVTYRYSGPTSDPSVKNVAIATANVVLEVEANPGTGTTAGTKADVLDEVGTLANKATEAASQASSYKDYAAASAQTAVESAAKAQTHAKTAETAAASAQSVAEKYDAEMTGYTLDGVFTITGTNAAPAVLFLQHVTRVNNLLLATLSVTADQSFTTVTRTLSITQGQAPKSGSVQGIGATTGGAIFSYHITATSLTLTFLDDHQYTPGDTIIINASYIPEETIIATNGDDLTY